LRIAIDDFSKLVKEIVDPGMFSGLSTVVWFEMPLGYVGSVRCSMDEYVIPRFILGRKGLGSDLIPFDRILKGFIQTDDHPTVSEFSVVNRLSYGELVH